LRREGVALVLKKKKGHMLKYKKASHELFRNYFTVSKSLEKVLWKRWSQGRVGQGGDRLIPDSLGKERLTGRKR
jgi:hypothetical protein